MGEMGQRDYMSSDRGQAVQEVREKRTTANHLYLSLRVDIYIQELLSV